MTTKVFVGDKGFGPTLYILEPTGGVSVIAQTHSIGIEAMKYLANHLPELSDTEKNEHTFQKTLSQG